MPLSPLKQFSLMLCLLFIQCIWQPLWSSSLAAACSTKPAQAELSVFYHMHCSLARRGQTLTKNCLHCCVFYPHEMPAVWECWGCETAACRKLHVSYLHYNRLSSFSTDQPLIIQQSFIHPFGEALNCGPFCLSLVIIQVEIRNPRVLFKKNRG